MVRPDIHFMSAICFQRRTAMRMEFVMQTAGLLNLRNVPSPTKGQGIIEKICVWFERLL